MTHIPGCIRSLSLSPEPRWPVALRNTRALHGVLTALAGRPHMPNMPNFALLPWPHDGGCLGWAVQWFDERDARLSGSHHVSIFNEPRVLTLGQAIGHRVPARPEERSHLMCLDTITPIVIRRTVDKRTVHHDSPDDACLVSALSCSSAVTLVTGKLEHPLWLRIVGGKTSPQSVPVGGNWGGDSRVRGFGGRLLLEVDGYTRWRLEIAQLMGLGGRVSLGFGRFRVREVARQ